MTKLWVKKKTVEERICEFVRDSSAVIPKLYQRYSIKELAESKRLISTNCDCRKCLVTNKEGRRLESYPEIDNDLKFIIAKMTDYSQNRKSWVGEIFDSCHLLIADHTNDGDIIVVRLSSIREALHHRMHPQLPLPEDDLDSSESDTMLSDGGGVRLPDGSILARIPPCSAVAASSLAGPDCMRKYPYSVVRHEVPLALEAFLDPNKFEVQLGEITCKETETPLSAYGGRLSFESGVLGRYILHVRTIDDIYSLLDYVPKDVQARELQLAVIRMKSMADQAVLCDLMRTNVQKFGVPQSNYSDECDSESFHASKGKSHADSVRIRTWAYSYRNNSIKMVSP